MRTRHRLSKIELLRYALDGARVERGLNAGNPDYTAEDWALLDNDIAEIERRIKLVEIAEQRKVQP